MRTRMTDMFGIRYPIMNAGMSYIAVPELVAAVSNAGGLGFLATGSLSPDKTRESIKRIRELTDKPFGVNVTLLFPHGQENAKVAVEEKVPVVNWSLGNAAALIQAVHGYGGKIIGTVTIVRHALRAEKDGADGLVATGHEAAAHGGDVTSFVLAPKLAKAVRIPVILAGGVSTGRGLAAALALGAEGVSMGTRFAMTQESPLNQRIADLLVKATEEETIYTDRIDGMPGRWLKTELAVATAKGRVSYLGSIGNALKLKKMLRLSCLQMLQVMVSNANPGKLARMSDALAQIDQAIVSGSLEKGCLPVGQTVGLIDDLPTVKEVIEDTVAEATVVLERLRGSASE